MSYEKAVKFSRNPKKGKKQPPGFSTLAGNERRKEPWLGGAWYEPGMEEERARYIEAYHAETERLLKEHPDLKLVD